VTAVREPVEPQLRAMLAEILGVDRAVVDRFPAGARLLSGPLGLTSVQGARLLVAVRDRWGVDVAAEDLALTSLESLASLAAFVDTRLG
jgi:acyl carrier protein